ncbi:MAG: sugar ABC transporter substrate-binding protein [Caldilineaceae bacterium]|nr:sugar ABC transporter substrate-binding protein [Caldilineaceae bacterium]
MSGQPTPFHQSMSRRDMLRLTGVGATGAALAACAVPAAAPDAGGDSAPAMEPVTIIATSGMPVNTFDNALERSLERLPNIAMEVNANSWGEGGWDGYSDTMLTRIAGGEQIDVIMIAIEGLRLLTAKNVLEVLDDFFAADEPANDILHNDIHVTLREMLQVDSKQYLFPFSWNNMVMYYNTTVFEEEGLDPPPTDWTWDDFLQTCLQVANVTGGADDRFAYSFWGASMFGMCAWYFNNDASPISDDWLDSNLLDPKVAETLQFLADLILEHKVAPNPEGWDEWAQFHAGNLVMRTCGRWCIAGTLEAEFDTYDIQYQPHNAGPLKTVAGTEGWGVSTSSENPQEAWEVVKHLSHSDTSIDLVKVGGSIPALRSVAAMPVFAEYGPPNTALFYESLDFAATVPSPTNFNIVEPILNRNYATIWNGERTVEEAMQAAHDELQPEMDKLKQA